MTLNAHLEKYLKPLERFLKKSGVVEICINRPQEVWVETEEGWLRPKKGGPIGPFIQPELTLSHLQGMVRHIALEQGQDFSKSCPSLSTSIPEYGFRIQAFGYASSPYGISISIRCGAARTFPIEGYFSGDDAKFMINAVKNDQTILVCGGTRSGKTTFLNSLIPSIPMDTRLGVVEDTQELNIPHPNQFRLLLSKTATDAGRMTWEDAINICMRMRPDRLMVGELDTRNTGSFLRIINTGHGGSMSSLHANSPKDAIRALVQNAMMDGVLNNADVVRDYAISGIQLIVFIERAKGRYKAHMELAEDLR